MSSTRATAGDAGSGAPFACFVREDETRTHSVLRALASKPARACLSDRTRSRGRRRAARHGADRFSRAQASLLCELLLTACTSPAGPVFPDGLGPPPPLAEDCPPVKMFAQDVFRIADLDRGRSCRAFLEQDECVLAIFEDCSDATPRVRRSWQGTMTPAREIHLVASYDAALVPLRSPKECSGFLHAPERGPPWSRLECTFATPEREPHPGIYFERALGNTPLGTLGEPFSIAPSSPSPGEAPTIASATLLPGVGREGELWAILATGDPRDGAPSTLYARSLAAGAEPTSKLAELPGLRRIRSSPTLDAVFVASANALFRFSASSKSLTSSRSFGAGDELIDLAIDAEDALLVALREGSGTRLLLYDVERLLPLKAGLLSISVDSMIMLPRARAPELALLTSKTEQSLIAIDRDLRVIDTSRVEIGNPPEHHALLSDRVAISIEGTSRYLEFDLADRDQSEDLSLPEGAAILAMLHDSGRSEVLLGAEDGLLTAIDVEGRRPLLESRVDLGGPIKEIHLDPNTRTIYAVLEGAREVARIAR